MHERQPTSSKRALIIEKAARRYVRLEGDREKLDLLLNRQAEVTVRMGQVYLVGNEEKADQATRKLEHIEFYWRGLIAGARASGHEDVAGYIQETFIDTIFGLEQEED